MNSGTNTAARQRPPVKPLGTTELLRFGGQRGLAVEASLALQATAGANRIAASHRRDNRSGVRHSASRGAEGSRGRDNVWRTSLLSIHEREAPSHGRGFI